MRHHLTSLAIATAAVGLGMAWMSQGAAAAQGVELQVADQGPYGDHLIDAQGMSLYLFEGDDELESTCYDACAKAWPPLLTKDEATAGQGVDEVDAHDGQAQGRLDPGGLQRPAAVSLRQGQAARRRQGTGGQGLWVGVVPDLTRGRDGRRGVSRDSTRGRLLPP